ncbi:MAG: riboflavin synthase subunit alpha [Parachlamydiales bacterium]|jgi:riboflavin synthase
MFTGIVRALCPIHDIKDMVNNKQIAISLPLSLSQGLKLGASIAVDGVCLTVVTIEETTVTFDVIPETLKRTTLGKLQPHILVNIERSATIGDEIGGHLLSGHVWGIVTIKEKRDFPDYSILTCACPAEWTKYLLPKGYVALDGVSLTLVDVVRNGMFTVHLIPETLQRTTLGKKKAGDSINLELDSQTQTIVDTIERLYGQEILPRLKA